jgi:hypothetical protein
MATFIEITGIFLFIRIGVCFDLYKPATRQVEKTHDAVGFYATVKRP